MKIGLEVQIQEGSAAFAEWKRENGSMIQKRLSNQTNWLGLMEFVLIAVSKLQPKPT